MAELSYPATLPNPSRAQHAPKQRTRTSDSAGLALYQNYQSDYTGTMSVEFFLTAEQLPIFYAWWKDDLLEGGRWFNCNWPALRPGALIAQVLGEPAWGHVYNGACKVTLTVQIRGASKTVGVGGPTDPLFAMVQLLLHGEGANNGTVFTDSSSYNRTMIKYGSAVTSTDQKLFGISSLAGAPNSDWNIECNSFDFQTRNFDFCLEHSMLFRGSTIDGGSAQRPLIHGSGITWFFIGANLLFIYNSNVIVTLAGFLTTGAWIRCAVSREGNVVRVFRDGLKLWEGTPPVSDISPTNRAISVGGFDGGGQQHWEGWVDEVRFTMGPAGSGAARRVADYPVDTLPFPDA